VQIAINQLLAVPRPERSPIMDRLYSAFLAEQEVELRQALLRVWVWTRQSEDLQDSGLH
jgi:hypothetical protein